MHLMNPYCVDCCKDAICCNQLCVCARLCAHDASQRNPTSQCFAKCSVQRVVCAAAAKNDQPPKCRMRAVPLCFAHCFFAVSLHRHVCTMSSSSVSQEAKHLRQLPAGAGAGAAAAAAEQQPKHQLGEQAQAAEPEAPASAASPALSHTSSSDEEWHAPNLKRKKPVASLNCPFHRGSSDSSDDSGCDSAATAKPVRRGRAVYRKTAGQSEHTHSSACDSSADERKKPRAPISGSQILWVSSAVLYTRLQLLPPYQ
jgi:hypothetical protein